MSNKFGVSIVLCCFNSAKRLPDTLFHLSQQKIPKNIEVEIIIVDNNSTDQTTGIAQEIWAKLHDPLPLKIIAQPIPGLAHAREKGIEEAAYEFIVLCDDDNWLEENYLTLAYRILTKNRGIGILGGQSEAVSDIPLPYWFSTYQAGYAVGVQNLESGDITSRGYVWGAGMVLRKSAFQKIKEAGFRPLLSDRKGKQLTSGGDSEYCMWFMLAGYKLWYDSRLKFRHYIPKERLTVDYCRKLFNSFCEYRPILNKYSLVKSMAARKQNKIKNGALFGYFLIQYLYYSLRKAKRLKDKYSQTLQLITPFPNITFDGDIQAIKKSLMRLNQSPSCQIDSPSQK